MTFTVSDFEAKWDSYMQEICDQSPDPSHDILHVRRVVALTKKIAANEGADMRIVVPAAYLHDCVAISKTDPRRKQASRISADTACHLLLQWGYPSEYFPAIRHAIEAHSFSAGVRAESLEAQVVQDADRLDAMGAVGIFRVSAFSGLAKRPFYFELDPFCASRIADDQTNTLDHYFLKLLKLQERLNTPTARAEGEKRLTFMQSYLSELRREILGP